ncbi:uncharacterized protein LY89DRAFT_777046 [Mollisia scopiformis]|uniref:Uncharacterized protein n=1 Tax=Mollisia scopiformis TaxID=149040 RepID=A0A194XSI1_MOLSC|nr:uncharacterized protein LY89DRAFT_777046 [Mollisia scopiformis]KUJ23260.1 hypothetical protein LY89DRAFT_777046 [Mollisia scopiformis]
MKANTGLLYGKNLLPMIYNCKIGTFQHNQVQVRLPRLKGDTRALYPQVVATVDVARVVEPFVSIIHHTCNGNAYVTFNGNELQLRAARDIAAWEEITRSWIAGWTAGPRQPMINRLLGRNCSCSLCSSTQTLPQRLAGRASSLEEVGPDKLPGKLSEVQRTISDIEKDGFGHSLSVRFLHKLAMIAFLMNGNEAEAFKHCIKIYYVVEPKIPPPEYISPQDRLSTLYRLCCFAAPMEIDDPEVGTVEVPPKMMALMTGSWAHLRYKLVKEIEKCFGADSAVAMVEKSDFEDKTALIDDTNRIHGEGGFRYVPLAESQMAREKFVEQMNELLVWAGVGKLSADELLAGS